MLSTLIPGDKQLLILGEKQLGDYLPLILALILSWFRILIVICICDLYQDPRYACGKSSQSSIPKRKMLHLAHRAVDRGEHLRLRDIVIPLQVSAQSGAHIQNIWRGGVLFDLEPTFMFVSDKCTDMYPPFIPSSCQTNTIKNSNVIQHFILRKFEHIVLR